MHNSAIPSIFRLRVCMTTLLCGVWLANIPAWGDDAACPLQRCIDTALRQNPSLEAMRQRIAMAQAAAGEARARRWPQLGLSAGATYSDNPSHAFMMRLNRRSLDFGAPTFDPNQADATGNIRLGVGIRYRLFDGQRAPASARAESATRAAAARERAARNDLVHTVTHAYFSLLQAQEYQQVMDSAVSRLEESLRVARERLDAGTTVRADVLYLEVQLAQVREDHIRAANAIRLAAAALNTAVGTDVIFPDTPIPVPAQLDPPSAPPSIENPESILRHRGEWQAMQHELAVARHALRQTVRGRYPTVDAMGEWALDGWEADAFEDSYTVGIASEWTLFSGGERRQAEARARAALAALQAEADALYHALRFDLQQTSLHLHESRERVAVTDAAHQNAQEALRITRERYQRGAAEITQLLTAELGLTTTQTRRLTARFDYQIACSDFARARGNGLRSIAGKNESPAP